jgi:hypothetical protein
MAEFDIPGLPLLRQELAQMAVTPGHRSSTLGRLIRELYDDIRQARITGHSWREISETITATTKVRCSQYALATNFRRIDSEWEKKTGVAALEPTPAKKRGRPRKDVLDKTA